MVYLINGKSFKYFASQGQQKSFLIALKLAQYNLIAKRLSIKPIILLDDLFDKLDIERVRNLLKTVLSDEFGQTFITDSNKFRIEEIFKGLGFSYNNIEFSNGSLLL
jgi:DNA replication and repair protein RecF